MYTFKIFFSAFLSRYDLRKESFLFFDLLKENLIKCSLNLDKRKLKYHNFLFFTMIRLDIEVVIKV